jgi:hypothetical protein
VFYTILKIYSDFFYLNNNKEQVFVMETQSFYECDIIITIIITITITTTTIIIILLSLFG